MAQDKAGRTRETQQQTPKQQPAGKNWLLVIAIDKYEHCAPLNNCVQDSKAIVEILQERYNFEQEHIIELYDKDANKRNIIAKLNDLSKKVRKNIDNLVIYFSGHGETEGEDEDDDDKIGYLVPVNAAKGDESDYLPHSYFKAKLNRIKTRHTFVIMDACFSGSFFINIKSDKRSGAEHIASRWGLSSSLSHEVALDGKPGDNSPFAQCLIDALQENNTSFGIHGLAEAVGQKMLARQAKQTPICLPFSDPNKYKGQFFFHPIKNATQAWATTEATDTAAAYKAYWDKHPDSPQAEEALWRYACKKNMIAAFKLYRKEYLKGKYRYEALDKIEDVVFANATTVRRLRKYLETFGEDARHAEEAHQRMEDILAGITIKPPKPAETIITPPEDLVVPEPPRLSFEPEMVFVEGGTFKMGSNDYDDEKPIHDVTVSDFYIGKYELTVAQFKAFIDDTAYQTDADKEGSSYIWTGSKVDKTKGVNWRCDVNGKIRPENEYDHPVIHVSWNDAVAYAKWLSEKTGKRYRLLTEAEWEYAARGGNKNKGCKYAGSDKLDEVGWYYDNSGSKTHPVGQKKPNELGIYDMSGNVWEWCGDWYGDYPSEPQSNPTGPVKGPLRVLRGGSWNNVNYICRVAYRNWDFPNIRYGRFGFRIAQDK
jgi:formylglycine-generating enzyme required for sulfatase activity